MNSGQLESGISASQVGQQKGRALFVSYSLELQLTLLSLCARMYTNLSAIQLVHMSACKLSQAYRVGKGGGKGERASSRVVTVDVDLEYSTFCFVH